MVDGNELAVSVTPASAAKCERQVYSAGSVLPCFRMLPWLVGLVLFTAYPVIYSFYLSFTSYNIIQDPKWIGLENYRTMFNVDPLTWFNMPLWLLCLAI